MERYRRLAVLPLLTLVLWATPASAFIFAANDDFSRHTSDQPLDDPEQEKEASELECEEFIFLFSSVGILEVSRGPAMRSDRHDEPICLPQPVLSGPDHSRAPPA